MSTFSTLTFDCADAATLAHFWAAVLELDVDTGATADFASITPDGAPSWMFIKVPEPKQAKNRVHVDLTAADFAGELLRVVTLGATRCGDFDESGHRWTTLADPEGNEFDLVAG